MPSHERTAPSIADMLKKGMKGTMNLGSLGSGSCLCATRLRGLRLRG